MLLRIDVYPHDAPVKVSKDDPTHCVSPMKPLHVCLATTQSSDNNHHKKKKQGNDEVVSFDDDMEGRLFSLGRKAGDILMPKDKSVSREHCILRLVSNEEQHQYTLNDDDELVAGRAIAPRTPAEEKACRDSPHGMCVVLENRGKLGCVVVRPQETRNVTAKATASRKDDDDSETGGDETDEEEAHTSQASTAIAVELLSPVAKHLLGKDPTKATMKTLSLDQSEILTELSSSSGHEQGRVICQCGKMGSTLVIYQESISFVKSSWDKKTSSYWKNRLHAIGAHETTDVLDPATSHVVTGSYSASPKQLAAWSRGLTFVTPDFFQALLDRRAPADDAPDPAAFAPKSDGNHLFWHDKANPRLWASCRYFCVKLDDVEVMARAAGATIVSLHDLKDAQAMERVEQVLQQEGGKGNCFAVTSTRKKLTKLLKQAGVPVLPAKALAKGISEQQLLTDDEGNTIGNPAENDESKAKKPSPAAPQEQACNTQKLPTSDEDEDKQVPSSGDVDSGKSQKTISSEEEKTKAKTTSQDMADNGKSNKEKDVSVDNDNEKLKGATEKSEDQVKSRSKARETETATDSRKNAHKSEKSDPVARKRDVEEQEDPKPTKKRRKVDLEPSTDDAEHDGKRKTLQLKSKSGWLAAAPGGKKRREFLRTKEEMQKLTGNDNLTIATAETEWCKDMIVGPANNANANPSLSSSIGNNNDNNSKKKKKDFKQFRKNTVVAQTQTFVTLRPVVPRESEQQRDYDEQRQALEEQQRRADELFRDPIQTTKGGTRRRRR